MATDKPITTLNVSLPESMKSFVEGEVAAGGYTSASEYMRELIRRAKKEREEQGSLEKLILEGLDSGPAREITPQYWKQLKASLAARMSKKRVK
jgi:antitoxin ParD1/3/4